MKIYMKSVPKHVPAKIVKQAINFYADKLKIKVKDQLKISLKFTDDFDYNEYGYVTFIDDNNRPKEFLMKFSKNLRGKNLFRILGHEMVHVRQYATGNLKELVRYPDITVFKKKRYKCVEKENAVESWLDYRYQPWEQEAYGLEDYLYHTFISEYNYKPIKDLTIKT